MKKTSLDRNAKKKRLLTVLLSIAVLLLLMFAAAELILPRITAHDTQKDDVRPAETRLFYDESRITEQDLAEYETLNRYISFKNHDDVEVLITDGDYESVGGAEAVLFGQYIEAIQNGDNRTYAACFSDQYDFENGTDHFADGTEAFPPQRLYDIRIEALDTLHDEQSGITQSLYDVRYRIYKNTGDFRRDMTDDTAPLLFLVETRDGVTRIVDIAYRYGNDTAQ